MKITAAVSRAGENFPLLETLELESPRADEVLVRVVATGICHTDIHCHAGTGMPVPQPIVLGHEASGIIEATGAGVTGLAPGDAVVLSGGSCGHCTNCRSGRPTYCAAAMAVAFGGQRLDGSTPLKKNGENIAGSFFGQSSFATHVVAPARSAVKVSLDDDPIQLFGPLACGMVTGAGSVLEALCVRPGESIVVFGAGSVGLAAIMASRIAGATEIVAVDLHTSRLELALELGATHAVQMSSQIAHELQSIRPHGFTYALATASAVDVFDLALESLAVEGTFGFVVAPGERWSADLGRLLAGGRKIQGIIGGSVNPHVYIPRLIEFWKKGWFPFDRLVKTYEFSNIAQAWEDTQTGRAVKPVLVMPR